MNERAAAVIQFIAFYLAAAGCAVAGVYLLFGLGWALLTVAPFALFICFMLAAGMKPNG